jgi:hypothetical protein
MPIEGDNRDEFFFQACTSHFHSTVVAQMTTQRIFLSKHARPFFHPTEVTLVSKSSGSRSIQSALLQQQFSISTST